VTPAALRPVFGARNENGREVEHLASHVSDNRCAEETLSASLAAIRLVVDDRVGFWDRGKVLARCTGLLARLFTRTTTTGLGRRLDVAVR
jgi:hypothetical protein